MSAWVPCHSCPTAPSVSMYFLTCLAPNSPLSDAAMPIPFVDCDPCSRRATPDLTRRLNGRRAAIDRPSAALCVAAPPARGLRDGGARRHALGGAGGVL